MNWYYAQNGQQAGPVTDEELTPLIQSGVIAPATLVWHSGLAGWQPFVEASGTLPEALRPRPGVGAGAGGGVAPGADQALCSQCGNVFPADEVVQVGGYNVCGACKPLLLQKLQQGVPSAGVYGVAAYRYAGFWIRFAAAILDSLILIPFYIVYYAVYFALYGSEISRAFTDAQHYQPAAGLQTGNWLLSLMSMCVLALYSAICISRFGAVPGMLVCGLRVIRPDGRRITLARGIGRFFANYLSSIILCLGYLLIVFDDQKRALHDYICDTRVIYK